MPSAAGSPPYTAGSVRGGGSRHASPPGSSSVGRTAISGPAVFTFAPSSKRSGAQPTFFGGSTPRTPYGPLWGLGHPAAPGSVSAAAGAPLPPRPHSAGGAAAAPSGGDAIQLARPRSLAAIAANRASSKPCNVLVGVRSRPLSEPELVAGDSDAWAYEPEQGLLYERREGATVREHAFDFVFPPLCRTEAVYASLGAPIVAAALEGVNSTLFAYGQTGSGKTYSLMGPLAAGSGVGFSAGIGSAAAAAAAAAFDAWAEEQAQAHAQSEAAAEAEAHGSGAGAASSSPMGIAGSSDGQSAVAGSRGRAAVAGRPAVGPAANEPGVIMLAVHDAFRRMEAAAATSDAEFHVRASVFELYNEEIRDLLNPEAGFGLRIADDPVTGPYVRGLTEEVVMSPERVLELVALGEAQRRTASTHMNAYSSRSHALFKLIIESRRSGDGPGAHTAADGDAAGSVGGPSAGRGITSPSGFSVASSSGGAGAGAGAGARPTSASGGRQADGDGDGAGSGSGSGSLVRVASLHFIDLAGSERVSRTGTSGVQLKESGVINASLLTLGVVIAKLITGEAHIPYRDSKLTRLLSTSLGGNAVTAVLTTISPAWANLGETRSSLQFAERAMKVRRTALIPAFNGVSPRQQRRFAIPFPPLR